MTKVKVNIVTKTVKLGKKKATLPYDETFLKPVCYGVEYNGEKINVQARSLVDLGNGTGEVSQAVLDKATASKKEWVAEKKEADKPVSFKIVKQTEKAVMGEIDVTVEFGSIYKNFTRSFWAPKSQMVDGKLKSWIAQAKKDEILKDLNLSGGVVELNFVV